MQHLHRLLLPKYTPLKKLRHQIILFWWIWKGARNIFSIPEEPETDFGKAQARFELWKQSKSVVQLLVSIAETTLEVYIWNSLLTKGSIIFPMATPNNSSLTENENLVVFCSLWFSWKNFTIAYHRFMKRTCLLHLYCTFLVRKAHNKSRT